MGERIKKRGGGLNRVGERIKKRGRGLKKSSGKKKGEFKALRTRVL